MEKPKSMTLKAIPEDVYSEMLKVQGDEKSRIKRQFSLESSIYKIIRSTIKKKKDL